MTLRPLVLALAAVSCAAAPAGPRARSTSTPDEARAAVDEFNRRMIDATLRMDDEAVLALWEDDGVSLLPKTKPIVGKAALAAFLAKVKTEIPGAKMRSFEMHCSGIEVEGDVATEYCDEHQVVDLGAGKEPFDGTGKMLFVLHRGPGGAFRLRREMWNQG